MHHTLEILELLEAIMSYFDPTYYKDRDTLAGLMRVCRVWFTPAASRLWRSSNETTFIPLMQNFLKCGQAELTRDFSIRTRRRRFQVYSSLVRKLRLDPDYNVEFPSQDDDLYVSLHDGLQKMIMLMGCAVLLPNLRELSFVAATGSHLSDIFAFLSPSLNELRLSDTRFFSDMGPQGRSSYAMAASSLLDLLPGRCPNLRVLSLRTMAFGNNSIHSRDLINVIREMQQLEMFLSGAVILSPALLMEIGRHPRLQLLNSEPSWFANNVDNEVHVSYADTFACIAGLPFSALKALHVTSSEARVTALMRYLPVDLEDVQVHIAVGAPCYGSLLKLAAYIEGRSSKLQHLGISIYQRFLTESSGMRLPWDFFALLIKCRIIAHFHFWYGLGSIELNDEHIASMAQAWPGLIDLSLRCPHSETIGSADRQILTLSSLLSLALHCPHLDKVSLESLSVRVIPPATHPPARLSSNTRWMSLRMYSIGVDTDDLEAIAAFLFALWPNVQVHWDPSFDGQKWSVIQRTVETMRSQRQGGAIQGSLM